jgi:hypothetical protein
LTIEAYIIMLPAYIGAVWMSFKLHQTLKRILALKEVED